MCKYVVTPFLAFAIVVTGPTTARAEPITLGSVLLGWLIGSTVSAGFEAVTGRSSPWDFVNDKPNVREMKRQLDALAAQDRTHATEIARLRDALNDRMTRAQVEQLLLQSLARVDKTLAEHAQRLKNLERETRELRAENRHLRERLVRQEGRSDIHEGRLNAHDNRFGLVEKRIDVHERWILDHERRIRDLERKVGVLGAQGFDYFKQGEYDRAVEKFEQAVENDPGDPGYYYGKALALVRLNRMEEAKKAVKTGTTAERLRAPGEWYRRVIEGVQGPHRHWLENTREEYLPIAVRP
jgi:tetratricopeptide (TPR) repeat protein